jgi:hypothetical protein
MASVIIVNAERLSVAMQTFQKAVAGDPVLHQYVREMNGRSREEITRRDSEHGARRMPVHPD